MSDQPRFVLVGHCGADCWMLSRTIEQTLPEAQIVEANSDADLEALAQAGDVWLVNRVLDGRFDARGGIELIRNLNAGDAGPRAVLISNYADSQSEAEAAGALPGFGKSQLNSPATIERLRELAQRE